MNKVKMRENWGKNGAKLEGDRGVYGGNMGQFEKKSEKMGGNKWKLRRIRRKH